MTREEYIELKRLIYGCLNKIPYYDREEAEQAINKIKKKNKGKRSKNRNLHTYRCEHCDWWHLTSKHS